MSIGESTTFWKLINSPEIEYIEIPKIQRDYVQGRNTDKVEYARNRIIQEIITNLELNKPMVLNFIYGKVENKVFIPIDGQQRLTTLFCLHAYALAKDGYSNSVLLNKFKYSTRTSTSRFLTELLTHLPEFFLQSEMDLIEFIEDAAWYSTEWNKDPSVNSFKVVLQIIHQKANHIQDLTSKLQSDRCPIAFMSLKIPDVGRINDLYIKMNSRGKPLTEFESFKSELFDFIDDNIGKADGFNKNDFKKKADNEWLSMIWSMCGKDAPKICDTIYMQFMHAVIMNRLIPGKYDDDSSEEWRKLNDNQGFYNFANYKPYLKDKLAIHDVFFTFEFYRFILATNEPDLHQEFTSLMLDINKLTHKEFVRIAAITQYALLVQKENWSVEGFRKWHRIFTNLINNTQIDKVDRYISACNSLRTIDADMANDADDYLIRTAGNEIAFFDSRQVAEELFKCKLIAENRLWKTPIVAAEKTPYFAGEIQFAFSLCGIISTDAVVDHPRAVQDFQETWKLICLLFSASAQANITVDDNLFRRALLVYGDYSCWANSSYTFFFEEGKGYFNWRRMLREEKSYKIFAMFFKDLSTRAPSTSKDIEKFLKEVIDNCTKTTCDEFSYYIVKIPAVMEYMRGKRFRKTDEYTSRNLIYSASRLSADYAEANTFFVFHSLPGENEYHYGRGYLDSDTSLAYIEKIGNQQCHIEFYAEGQPVGYFCDNDKRPYLNSNNQPICTVDEMLNYIKQHF